MNAFINTVLASWRAPDKQLSLRINSFCLAVDRATLVSIYHQLSAIFFGGGSLSPGPALLDVQSEDTLTTHGGSVGVDPQ